MALRVPFAQMLHVVAACRARSIARAIRSRGRPEQCAPVGAPSQPVRGIKGVAGLVPQNAHEPVDVAAFDLARHLALQAHEPRVRQIERHGDTRHAVGGKPFLSKPDMRAKANAALVELAVEAIDVPLERRAMQVQLQIAHAQSQQLLIVQARPR